MALIYNLDHISDKQKKSNIRKAIAILEKSYYSKSEEKSFFLDPFEQRVIKDIANKNQIDISFIGGNNMAERKIFVANYFYLPLYEANYISVLEFNSNNISHPDVLGALIHLGIERNDIGDISILDTKIEFVVSLDLANFIEFNLTKIKNERVVIKHKDNNKLEIAGFEFVKKNGFITSNRLDNIISEFISTSRTKAKKLILSKMVKVNFQIIDNPAYKVRDQSLISVRQVGRFIYDGVEGSSKKGNKRIAYRKLT